MNLKCLVPLFSKTILTKINDLVVGTHSLANETFSSFYNSEHQDGIIMKTTKCVIDYTYKFLNNHPSVKPCENPATIVGMMDENLLLEPKEILNGTTNIFGKEYNIADNSESYSTLTLNDVVEFLGLEDCSIESVTNALQKWAISQIPTTTTITTELPTTTENFSTMSYFDNNESNCLTPGNILIATGIGIAGITIGGMLGYFVGKYQKQKNVIKDYKNINSQLKGENLELQQDYTTLLVTKEQNYAGNCEPTLITPYAVTNIVVQNDEIPLTGINQTGTPDYEIMP
ncbi:MAG: hypothetical protein LN567_04675 [Rickettsia endosymbiont of Graphium doson]|nr:hypothetical protein [Rickettsia endosymbiont of Graphium doson]